jgi:putative membrane protein
MEAKGSRRGNARYRRMWLRLPKSQWVTLASLGVLLLLVQIDQPFPHVAWRYHVPTAVLLITSPWLLRRWRLSTTSVGCIVLFLGLHTVGGRWSYSFVPYDTLAQWLTGSTISNAFGSTRNHYDRLVHFSYGLLMVRPMYEVLVRHFKVPPRVATYIAFENVLAVSALFEIIEWLATVTDLSPSVAGYNGRQGDMWDPQKDMLLAGLGALCMTAIQIWRDNCAYRLTSAETPCDITASSAGLVASQPEYPDREGSTYDAAAAATRGHPF